MANKINTVFPEGFAGEKKEFLKDTLPDLYDAMKTGAILQEKVVGIEKIDGKDALVVFFNQNIKGIIFEEEAGLRPKEKLHYLVGTMVNFKVKHIDRQNNIVYLSRKEALEKMSGITWETLIKDAQKMLEVYKIIQKKKEEYRKAKEIGDKVRMQELYNEINKLTEKMESLGPVRTCVVKHVTDRVAYVDIGGITATLPRREVSWGYVDDVRNYIQTGDSFDVRVIFFDKDTGYVEVSIKQLLPDPWGYVPDKYNEGGLYVGKLVKIFPKGLLIEFEPAVMCMVPHLPYGNPNEGSELLVKLTKIDQDERKMYGYVVKVVKKV
ncbi:MAG: S1 RNA-binding domain-containing protein [Thermovenabulum sp.]|uniref:S1 RNA-binding domain-containing protein n=1 Tax=Thermovenabulum sp. TaxID=3100335 RepID=UPI003C7A9F01